jgi:predicted nuclease of restriction endonuclease-like (RecB) superfamily
MVSELAKNYTGILADLKEKISQARSQAILTVNRQLLSLYWEVGNTILNQQKEEGWGAKIIDRLASDLRSEFPDMKGLSTRNLKYMRAFAEAYPDFVIENQIVQGSPAQIAENQFVQAPLAQLSWYHHITLLDKVKKTPVRLFYIHKAVENNWSRNVMVTQIESGLYERQGAALTNFERTLSAKQSDLARETFKSPYLFDFLAMGVSIQERELENALIAHMKKFLLELGNGFAFVGSQYNLNINGDDYYLDLLFYHIKLHCFVILELKVGEFQPEFAGKLNFYINSVDAQLKTAEDNQTIGVLLCKTPNKTIVQYALHGVQTPMGVAEYELIKALPKELKGEIPTVAELEREMDAEAEKFLRPAEKKMNKLKEMLSEMKNEEVKEKLDKTNTEKIFSKVVLPFKADLTISLKEIAKMFERSVITFGLDTHQFDTEDQVLAQLRRKDNWRQFSIHFNFWGFKKAGTKAFIYWKYLYINLEDYRYAVSLEQQNGEPLLEKLYHQLLSEQEIDQVVEKFTEIVLDEITKQVERIKG